MEAFIYDAVRTVRGKGIIKVPLGITPTELVKQTMVHLKDKHNIDTTLVKILFLAVLPSYGPSCKYCKIRSTSC